MAAPNPLVLFKLFVYQDPANGTFPDPEVTDIPALTEKQKSLLGLYCPVNKVNDLLQSVRRQNIWLGIGMRGGEVVNRWNEGNRPCLPNNIHIPAEGNFKAKKLDAADAAPITRDTLYDEVKKLAELYQLNSNFSVPLITVHPAWRHPHEKKSDIGAGINFDGRFAYELKDVKPDTVKIIVNSMAAQFLSILTDLHEEHTADTVLERVELKDCKPHPIYKCDGLCGAWYIVDIQYTEDIVGRKTPKKLKIRIPAGLLKPNPVQGSDLQIIEESFSHEETRNSYPNVYTLGLDVRFLCEKAPSLLCCRSYEMQIKSHWNFLKGDLKKNKLPISDSSDMMLPLQKFCAHPSRKEFCEATYADKDSLAKKIAPDIVGKEPLAVFTETGIHLLQSEKQIGAWCVRNGLLDLLFYAPPWTKEAPWLEQKLDYTFQKNINNWRQPVNNFPGGREALEDEVILIGDAKDYARQLLTVFVSEKIIELPDDRVKKNKWNDLVATKIKQFREIDTNGRQAIINSLWELLTTPGEFNRKSEVMFEPREADDKKKSLPTSWHPIENRKIYGNFYLWKNLCVGFRIDGEWKDLGSTLNRFKENHGQGMTQWRLNDDLLYKIRHLTFKGTVLEDINIPRMWNKNNDTFNETAVCVSRNFFGAMAFPNRYSIGRYALFAVDCRDLVGYDTEDYQRNLDGYKVWRPGEKAFKQIPFQNVIGWLCVERCGEAYGIDGWKFNIDDQTNWLYNEKWVNPDSPIIKAYIEEECRVWKGGERNIPGTYDFAR